MDFLHWDGDQSLILVIVHHKDKISILAFFILGSTQSIDTPSIRHYKGGMKSTRWIWLAGIFLLLAACNLPKPTPKPPTLTPGPSPTNTPIPTITPTPTLSPTPTPPPAARIVSGEKALANGDYFQARDEFQIALASNSDEAVRADALWGLARTDFLYENYPSALENLRALAQTYPQSQHFARTHFLLGETYADLGRYQEAADSYAAYMKLRPGLLDGYAQEKRGDALYALANYPDALAAYQEALKVSEQAKPTALNIKIANCYANGGNAATALTLYDEIYTVTGNDYVKAQMDFLAGRALISLGRPSEAYDRWRHTVENFPLSYDSYSALVGLLDANQPVSNFDRGLVDFFAGQYGVALAAFDRYITENPTHDGTAFHYRGLILREMGDYAAAIESWDKLIAGYAGNRYWASAWDEKAFTQWAYLDRHDDAAKTLQDFAATASNSSITLTYLIEAGRIYEREGKLNEAATLWESLPDKYPSDPSFLNVFSLAGIVRYRLADYPKALQDFQRALPQAAEPADRARLLFWIGKTYLASGDKANATTTWQQAQAIDTIGYYSLRARDLLDGRAPFAAPPSMNLEYDLSAERKQAASWVRVKFGLPGETDLSNLGALASDLRLQRGTEFWQVGMYNEARLEFEALREAIQDDPADSFRLGNYLLDLGVYRPAIFAIRQVLTLAGMDDHSESLNTPVYFKHVRYGLYFSDIAWPAAAENAIDPLLVTSIIRQESLFEGFVRSTAGARGLMQIIPPTGASIAQNMGWPPNYKEDDLYSPYVSIRMGTYYFNANRRLLNGDLYATLAAYNGGPGNAQAWQELARGDQDLQLEIIRFAETRDYIRSIYETYTIYRSLYSPMQ